MSRWNKMRKFGVQRYCQRPRNDQQMQMLYNEHKSLLPSVEKIELEWSKKGAGQAGARHFKYYVVDPLKYWNKELEVSMKKSIEETISPKVRVSLRGGESHELHVSGKSSRQILEEIVKLDPKGEIVKFGPGYLRRYE